MTNITATQGDTIILATTITRRNPQTGVVAPVDITDAKLWFTAKFSLAETDDDALIRLGSEETGLDGVNKSPTPADGEATVTVPNTATDGLSSNLVWVFWDIQMEEVDGTVTTVDSGRMALKPDATRAS